MSGYGGQPPPGWDDPYNPGGQGSPGYGTPGYGAGAPGYGAPGYGGPPGYGPPGVPHSQGGSNASAIVALVCNAVATLICCNLLTIPGIVTGALAVGKAATDPAASRTLTIWSWVIFGVSMALGVVLLILMIATGVFSEDEYQPGGTTGI
ncbi:hypothetical protein [Actinomadura xylanilytica]|uniref:hypothetical protein n=1 Tax=Actinomadura xylanilytica TaxID=887459 RepID=UPI00255AD205|nr:hypothetical protein [Actinomadura xylanilytica]MDL4772704.1 hypothetical protein [Actinomadura xylanilytica]